MTATNSLQYFQFNFHTFGSTYIRFIYYNMINKFSVTVTTSLRIYDVLVLCDHGYDTFRVFVFFSLNMPSAKFNSIQSTSENYMK